MNITVKIEASELADAINNLAVAMSDMLTARNESKAEKTAEAAVSKAKSKKKPQSAEGEITDSDGSDQPSAQVAAVEVADTTPAPIISEAVTPADKAEIQKLAQAKSKTAGVEAVKTAIAKFGGKNINSTPDEKLIELKVALEAL